MKRLISVILAICLMAAVTSISSSAAEATITTSSVVERQGKVVTLNVSVSGNTGFSFLRLGYDYDQTALTLVEITNGGVSTDNFSYSTKNILWDSGADAEGNGLLCKLTFRISDDASFDYHKVNIYLRECYNYDEQDVSFTAAGGNVLVAEVPGDADGDHSVTAKDVALFKNVITAAAGTQNIPRKQCDINGDGVITAHDLAALKYLLAK